MPRRKKTSPNNATKDTSSSNTNIIGQDTTSTPTTNTPEILPSSVNKENVEMPTDKLPKKRVGARIHSAKRNKNQKKLGQKDSRITLNIEGYAFQDDIIGVTHVRSDGEDAFNHTLRNMIIDGILECNGFSSYVTLRDRNSGKMDDHLYGADGYPRYMFMSINVHNFKNANDASKSVLDQCQQLHDVSRYHLTMVISVTVLNHHLLFLHFI